MQPKKFNKIWLVVGAAVFLLVLLIMWLVNFGPGQKVSVELFIVPGDAKVTIDGQAIDGRKVRILKGEHVIAASREHFKSVQQKINTATIDSSGRVYLALFPSDAEGETYLSNHPEEQSRYERVGGAEFFGVQEILEDLPFTKHLPYQTIDYKVDYDITTDRTLVFLATLYIPAAVVPGSNDYTAEVKRLKAEVVKYLQAQDKDTKNVPIKFKTDAGDAV
jgi:hypothetical protein